MDQIHEKIEGAEIRSRLMRLGWNESEIQDLDLAIKECAKIPKATKIWVYGSMARGEQDRKKDRRSDMDIAVEVEILDDGDWKRTETVGKNSGRTIQMQTFRTGYDEEKAAYNGSEWVSSEIKRDAARRLHDQIVVWEAKQY